MNSLYWNRCDKCGQFISFSDFEKGATRIMITPDTHYSEEQYETLCIEHSKPKVKRVVHSRSTTVTGSF